MRTLVLEHAQKPASAITIDLAQVASCDTAGLQLLSSARQSALSAGRTWRLINPSAAVLHTCAEAALKPEQLGL